MEGTFPSGKSGIMVSMVIERSLPLCGTSLGIVIVGKKLKEEPFLLCN